jgi:3,4-dihydroxy 2-butanone 4-phosphate synthase/GTP cyclohydrolase II
LNVESFTAHAADFARRHGRPLVTLSYAQSLDGCLTTARGQPTALSGAQAMTFTHRLRAAHEAILVGIGTILADNPRLTVRLAEGRSPQPVVLDTHLRFPPNANLAAPWLFCGPQADPRRRAEMESRGARVFAVPVNAENRLELGSVLRTLAEQGITSLMVEGGAGAITSFLQAHLADQVAITVAPILLGGLRAVEKPIDAKLANPVYEQLGDDLVVVAELR